MRVSTAAFVAFAVLGAKDLAQPAIANAAPAPADPMAKATPTAKPQPAIALVTPISSLETVSPPAFSTATAAPAAAEPTPPIAVEVMEQSDGAIEAIRAETVSSAVLPDLPVAPIHTASEQPIVSPTVTESPRFASVDRLPTPALTPNVTPETMVLPMEHPTDWTEGRQDVLPNEARPVSPIAQSPEAAPDDLPTEQEIQDLQQQLSQVGQIEDPLFGEVDQGSPGITIANPSGFGADRFTGFVNFGFQGRLRDGDEADAAAGIGIGFGDARETVGLQLSYMLASFGTRGRSFGTGGLNAKLHRQFPSGLGVAIGWEGLIRTGGETDEIDFEDTVYGSVSQILRLRPDVRQPFSRIALTVGLGNGRFRSEANVRDDVETVNVFGSVALRVAKPLSTIVEWTGQDLAIGLSITPIRNFPLVITPALRDVAGAGDGARFVLGAGVAFRL
jgi:hypothetical protein